MTYAFTVERQKELARKYSSMKVLRNTAGILDEANKIIAKRSLYAQAEKATGVPWWLVGVIDAREGGISHLGTRHLHNGDSLQAFTHNVPAGRPLVGHPPPFTWLESAIDALKLKGFDKIKDWNVARSLHELEPYNGLGYYYGPTDKRINKKYPPMPSPYIWSCTDQYDPPFGPGGKYIADGIFDAKTVDQQIGCAPLIRKILELTETKMTTGAPTTTKQVAKATTVAAAPAAAATTAHYYGFSPLVVTLIGVVVDIAVAWALYRNTHKE